MEANYTINRVSSPALPDGGQSNINPLFIELTDENGKEWKVLVQVTITGVSEITTDWPYLERLDDMDENDLNVLRNRIIKLMNDAGLWISTEKKKLENENKNK